MQPNKKCETHPIKRIPHAMRHAFRGLYFACTTEQSVIAEICCLIIMIPAGLYLGQTMVQRVLLVGSALMVLVVELLNTAIEITLDRMSNEWHELTRNAKDLGAAAVFMMILMTIGTWVLVLWPRFAPRI